jgi:AcrR family transcriptional regulator
LQWELEIIMPRPKKSETELQETREAILDAAYAILIKEGPKAISSRSLADSLKIAHMTLFTYFKDQADIVNALKERELNKFRTKERNIIEKASKENLKAVLVEILEFYIAFANKNPEIFKLAWVLPELGIEDPEQDRKRMRDTVSNLAGLIEMGISENLFTKRNPVLCASLILGIINMPNILFYSGKISNLALRDHLLKESLRTAMLYLEN